MRKKVGRKRSALETVEGALFLFALACIVVGTFAGVAIMGVARPGCSP